MACKCTVMFIAFLIRKSVEPMRKQGSEVHGEQPEINLERNVVAKYYGHHNYCETALRLENEDMIL